MENDCFDMKDLFVTAGERDRKFSGHRDFKFKNPLKDPYRDLLENLRRYDLMPALEEIQALEDQVEFLEASKGAKREKLSRSYEEVVLKDYKPDLCKRFGDTQKHFALQLHGGTEARRKAMENCIELVKEIARFACDACLVHNLLRQMF